MAADTSFSTEIDSMVEGSISEKSYSTPSSSTSGAPPVEFSELTPRIEIVALSRPGCEPPWLTQIPGVL